jgi:fatty-acyl-CoA synthase
LFLSPPPSFSREQLTRIGRNCAFVELKPGENASAEEIIAWCRQNLAGYKTPRYVVFTELPKTSTGKIQKFRLREMAKNV